MENNLPEGWEEIELSEITNYKKGKKPKKMQATFFEDALVYLDIKAIEKGNDEIFVDKESSNFTDENDLIVVWDGARAGWVAKSRTGAIGSTIMSLTPKIDKDFLFRFLQTQFNYLQSNLRGTGIPHVDPDIFWNIKIPIAPLSEQQRIASKLDSVMQKVLSNKQRLDKIPKLLKRFRQSVLAAAVSGRLTEEWREKNKNVERADALLETIKQERIKRYDEACKKAKKENSRKLPKPSNLDVKLIIDAEVEQLTLNIPANWVNIPLAIVSANIPNSIVDGPFGSSINVKTDYIETGVPVIRINNVRPLHFSNENLKYIRKEKFSELSRHKISSGDIILAKVGATIGDCCIYPFGLPIAMLSTTGSCRITVDEEYFNREFICYVLCSLKNVMQHIASVVAQPFLNMATVKNIPVPLCSLEEQNEIVKRVEQLFTFADKLDARYTKAKTTIDKLPQSILAKAFRGELVPQNPDDEPARVLLGRIKKEKEKLNGEKRKPKKEKATA